MRKNKRKNLHEIKYFGKFFFRDFLISLDNNINSNNKIKFTYFEMRSYEKLLLVNLISIGRLTDFCPSLFVARKNKDVEKCHSLRKTRYAISLLFKTAMHGSY